MTQEMNPLADVPEEYVAITEDGGLKKKILRAGSGKCPTHASQVEVHYTGTLYPSGEQFDSSRTRGDTFSFKLGVHQVIKGWDEGVKMMQIGELAELICAPDYGYGASGSPPTIPPNSVLKFEVELFGFEEAADTDEKRLAFAIAQKEEGNKAFCEKQNDVAAAAYEKALSYLGKMTSGSDEAKALEKACHLNAAQAYLHLKEANKAMQHLKATGDDQSLKYNYRLAQTHTLMQDWPAAEAAFKRASEVADDKMKVVLQREMVQLQQKKKLEAQRNKQTWGKLFA